MANYRFKTAEIEAMKKNILTHIEREAETKTAWRLRCAIEGQLMCCRPSKREAARLERELALYEKLTKNDLPNWQSEPTQPATPTETPRISTETAETVNVSTEEKKAAVAAKKPIWKQANELAGEYKKRGYQFVYNERTKLCYLTIPGHIFVDGSQYTTELTYVMTSKIDDFRDVPKAVGEYNAMYCAKYAERCPQMLSYLPTEPREAGIGREPQGREAKCKLAPSWVANRVLPHGFRVLCFNSYPNGDFSISVENKEGCRILTKDEFRKLCSEPPQSPETPQTVEHTAEPPKPRETARKRPNRAIGSAQHHQCSALGANGYAVLNDASATMAAMNVRCDTLRDTLRSVTHVPRECSTVDAAHW